MVRVLPSTHCTGSVCTVLHGSWDAPVVIFVSPEQHPMLPTPPPIQPLPLRMRARGKWGG
jgi:hypothetical protein